MKESELKFEVRDFNKIREGLVSIDARAIWRGVEHTQYFDYPDKSLAKKGISLRIREWKNHSVFVTCKQNLKNGKNSKNREEIQFVIDKKGMKEFEATLELLGLVRTFQYEKRREHWEIDTKTHIELDELKTGQRFVEIEGTERKIVTISKVLNIIDCPKNFKSYPEIIKSLVNKK